MPRHEWRTSVWLAGLLACVMGYTGTRGASQPETLTLTGWEHYRLGEFGQARRDFRAVLASTAQDGQARQAALYGLATTWNLQRPDEDVARAARLYREAIAQGPTNELAAWSWLALARMQAMPVAGERPGVGAAVAGYQQVIDRFPFHPAGEEAFLLQQSVWLEQPAQARAQAVLDALDAFLRTHSSSPWRGAAFGLEVSCCAVLGRGDQRLDAALQEWKAAEGDAADPLVDRSWTYWRIATIAEFDAGDFATAREFYGKLIANYPTEQKVFLARQELQRMDNLESRLRQEAK